MVLLKIKKHSVGIQEKFSDDASILAHLERQESDGYRDEF